MYSKQEILDFGIDRLELSVRTVHALRKRFGEHILIRELVTLNEAQIKTELKHFHKHSKIFVKDINAGLAKHSFSLGTSWADLPPSKHAVVRNPQQMCAYKGTH